MNDNNLTITTIQQILAGRNDDFDKSNSIKLVRHADTRKPEERPIMVNGNPFKGTLLELYRQDIEIFKEYQCRQKSGTFEKTDYLVVFVGERGTRARFIAVYKVGKAVPNPEVNGEVIIDLQEVEEFKFLSRRVVIDWGKSTVSWHQDFRNQIKPVIRIDEGFVDENGVPRFISYSDTILSFDDLKAIFTTDDEVWKNKLQAVNGIYMIVDKLNGKQYVGSTFGTKGIWGRWQCYFMTNGHGGNKDLEDLISQDPDYANHFQWIILETLSIRITEREAISRENLYKEKFVTREFGYNLN